MVRFRFSAPLLLALPLVQQPGCWEVNIRWLLKVTIETNTLRKILESKMAEEKETPKEKITLYFSTVPGNHEVMNSFREYWILPPERLFLSHENISEFLSKIFYLSILGLGLQSLAEVWTPTMLLALANHSVVTKLQAYKDWTFFVCLGSPDTLKTRDSKQIRYHFLLQMRKAQTEIESTLQANKIDYEIKDIAASSRDKIRMRSYANNEKALPPQIVNGNHYCGVSID